MGNEGPAQLSLTAGAGCDETRASRQLNAILPSIFYRNPFLRPFHCEEHGHIFNRPPSQASQPLQLAVAPEHESVAMPLIEHVADIKKLYLEEMAKCTMIHHASAHGLIPTIQLLLEKGTNIEARDEEGQTPLRYTVKPNQLHPRGVRNIETVQHLLSKRANHYIRDMSGQKPRELANKVLVGWRTSEQEQQDDIQIEKKINRPLDAKEAG